MLGHIATQIGYELTDGNISDDIGDIVFFWDGGLLNIGTGVLHGYGANAEKVVKGVGYGAIGYRDQSFMLDYYYRIHVFPQRLNIGTVASDQTRVVSVWNAWPTIEAILDSVTASETNGVEITGESTPYTMGRLEELEFSVTIDALGPPNIDIFINFDFVNVDDPLPINIVGTRALRFDILPEVPAKELWEWLTDVLVSNDGSEQRLSLRGAMPRIRQEFKTIMDTEQKVKNLQTLYTTSHRNIWLPEWQYATKSTQDSLAGSFRLYFNSTLTDIRNGEYLLIKLANENSMLVQVDTMLIDGCNVVSPLLVDIPTGSFIAPGSAAILDSEPTLQRYAVNQVAEFEVSAIMQRTRTSLSKTDAPPDTPFFLSIPVLYVRPLANELVDEVLVSKDDLLDSTIGPMKLVTDWKFPRIGGQREYIVERRPTLSCPNDTRKSIDFWKYFLNYIRGCRKFWMPSFRDDFTLAAPASSGTVALTLREGDYAEKVWLTLPTHRYFEIHTDAGVHRVTVTAAEFVDGYSNIIINPALPLGAGWTNINRISYLIPCRLAESPVELEHYAQDTFLRLSYRTAENVRRHD